MNPFSGETELVLGCFRSIRVFKVVRTALQPVSFWNVITYHNPNEWYTFECNRWRWDDELVLRRFLEHKRWLPSTPVRIIYKFSDYYNGKRALRIQFSMPLNFGLFREQRWEESESFIPWDDAFMIPDRCTEPRANCSCGFYSFYTKDKLLQGASYWNMSQVEDYVFGIVESAGKVLHGTHGIRAERMRILAISTPSPFFVRPANDIIKRKFPYFKYLEFMLAAYPLDKPPV